MAIHSFTSLPKPVRYSLLAVVSIILVASVALASVIVIKKLQPASTNPSATEQQLRDTASKTKQSADQAAANGNKAEAVELYKKAAEEYKAADKKSTVYSESQPSPDVINTESRAALEQSLPAQPAAPTVPFGGGGTTQPTRR